MWMMGCNDRGDQLHGNQDSFNGRKQIVMAEQNKREYTTHQVAVSSRWNPTPEQLQTLENLYRRGLRTPSADQIQHMTAQLRRYGKIEGKNVFYWFQNHKARERQKRRRQLNQEPCDVHDLERKKHSSPVIEVEQTYNKKLASPRKSSTTISQKSMARGETEEQEERRNLSNRQMLPLSSSNFPSPNNLINSSVSATVPLKYRPFRDGGGGVAEQATTLQLFPVQGGDLPPYEEDQSIVAHAKYNYDDEDVTPHDHNYRFFEFLPLKKF